MLGHVTGVSGPRDSPALELALVDQGCLVARGGLARLEEGVIGHESLLSAESGVLLPCDKRGHCGVKRVEGSRASLLLGSRRVVEGGGGVHVLILRGIERLIEAAFVSGFTSRGHQGALGRLLAIPCDGLGLTKLSWLGHVIGGSSCPD